MKKRKNITQLVEEWVLIKQKKNKHFMSLQLAEYLDDLCEFVNKHYKERQ